MALRKTTKGSGSKLKPFRDVCTRKICPDLMRIFKMQAMQSLEHPRLNIWRRSGIIMVVSKPTRVLYAGWTTQGSVWKNVERQDAVARVSVKHIAISEVPLVALHIQQICRVKSRLSHIFLSLGSFNCCIKFPFFVRKTTYVFRPRNQCLIRIVMPAQVKHLTVSLPVTTVSHTKNP